MNKIEYTACCLHFIDNMLYVGFPVNIEEALRLLGLKEDFVSSFYDTEPIQGYLKKKGSQLVFQYIDKGACLLAFPLYSLRNHPQAYETVDDTIYNIISAKRLFLSECENLHIDLSEVEINWIEEEPRRLKNPEPYVLSI